mmetsp:Transcript_1215/g.3146  ORF Transcript_1215/g.3146 Transcript_1215/m.3146 type:complete len:247 (+) Transcript_1215:989-1729(+)
MARSKRDMLLLQCVQACLEVRQRRVEGLLFFRSHFCRRRFLLRGIESHQLAVHFDTQFGQHLVGHFIRLLIQFIIVKCVNKSIIHHLFLDIQFLILSLEFCQNLHRLLGIHRRIGRGHGSRDRSNGRSRRHLCRHACGMHPHGSQLGLCAGQLFLLTPYIHQLFCQGFESRVLGRIDPRGFGSLFQFHRDLLLLSIQFSHFPIQISLSATDFSSCFSLSGLGGFLGSGFLLEKIHGIAAHGVDFLE